MRTPRRYPAPYALRLDSTLVDGLRRWGVAEGRSLNAIIRDVLGAAVWAHRLPTTPLAPGLLNQIEPTAGRLGESVEEFVTRSVHLRLDAVEDGS
jgi:hypothetical protein